MYPEMPYYGEKTKNKKETLTFPPQSQPTLPGQEQEMDPRPIVDNPEYQGSQKLKGKTAIITGGDSGIGKAAAIAFGKEGANVMIAYLNEHQDAEETQKIIRSLGGECLLVPVDLSKTSAAQKVVQQTLNAYSQIDILVNNCATQYPQKSIMDITEQQLELTFKTNIFSYFFMIQAVLPHMKSGASIINTTSITAYKGNKELIDYSATKGAVTTLTRSLSLSLADTGIRVNGVAPGPIWTPLIPGSFTEDNVSTFGNNTPMKRAGQPFELAPAYVYLASDDSAFMNGQVLHINGGDIVNG
ncbi:SDR family oxidoreductase [Tuberibacillus sp. Marseille-P3662]|uniref:SDR family oxidoreductase n=1 Tax=Tuberibacillus sp. Marseille-P3662 TaxID=1965358 RepID=UPI000A1C9B28|nr:SDR family oxidoreductase [Tuberibacillus sp. Marseille-P3662]